MRYLLTILVSYSDLSFRFDGTPTNNLELAFGTDVNTNGVLEAEEVGARFGWRAGRYVIENTSTGDMFDGDMATTSPGVGLRIGLTTPLRIADLPSG